MCTATNTLHHLTEKYMYSINLIQTATSDEQSISAKVNEAFSAARLSVVTTDTGWQIKWDINLPSELCVHCTHGQSERALDSAIKPIPNVVLRDNLPTLLQEKDIKMSDTRLYTKPTAVELTDSEITEILSLPSVAERNDAGGWHVLPHAFARAVEAKLKEKANG